MAAKLESALAILNGLVGDHLAKTGNGLVTAAAFHHEGNALRLDRASLEAAFPKATPRIVVLVHGLMVTESVWAFPDGGDYGTYLARDLGFTPFYLRYNTGLPIAENGQALARLLNDLLRAYPVPPSEIVLVGYSMGGLVVRSACHEGARTESPFLPLVRRAIYVATPHLGAPYERLGRLVTKVLRDIDDPYTKLLGDIANLRSAGLQDLGDADVRHEDRSRRQVGVRLSDWQHPVPLLPQIKHHLVAGRLVGVPWVRELFGDSVVPLASALAGERSDAVVENAPLPVRIFDGLSHLALAHDLGVYEQIKAWAAA